MISPVRDDVGKDRDIYQSALQSHIPVQWRPSVLETQSKIIMVQSKAKTKIAVTKSLRRILLKMNFSITNELAKQNYTWDNGQRLDSDIVKRTNSEKISSDLLLRQRDIDQPVCLQE